MANKTTAATRDLSDADIEQVFRTVDIPACPGIVSDVLAEAQRDVPDLWKLAKVVSRDPGTTAAALKLANSPLFRSGEPITDVRHALERLGTRNVVCVIVAIALRSTVRGGQAAWLEHFWNRASTLASAAGLVARRTYGVSPDAAFLYAMFQDAAVPLMMTRFPAYGQQMQAACGKGLSRVEAEEQYFPCSHPVVGSLLIRNWGLPSLIGQAIRFHHAADVYDLPDTALPGAAVSLIAVVHVAEHLAADLLDSEVMEVNAALTQRAAVHLGISPDELDDLQERLLDAMRGA